MFIVWFRCSLFVVLPSDNHNGEDLTERTVLSCGKWHYVE